MEIPDNLPSLGVEPWEADCDGWPILIYAPPRGFEHGDESQLICEVPLTDHGPSDAEQIVHARAIECVPELVQLLREIDRTYKDPPMDENGVYAEELSDEAFFGDDYIPLFHRCTELLERIDGKTS